jgi:hypothetical protein
MTSLMHHLRILLVLTLLTACVPYISSYQKVEAPAAIYFNPSCLGGPASIAYYPFHGIYISIDADSSSVGLHIPPGYVAQLNGTTMEIAGLIGGVPYKGTVELEAAKHPIGSSGSPAQFYVLSEPYTAKDNFGPLVGGGDGQYIRWYLYSAKGHDYRNPVVPKGLTEGTIEIPAMTINGQRYDAQKLTFKRKTSVGLEVINC